MNPNRSKIFSFIKKWGLRFLVFQLLLINTSSAFHAYRLTHFYDDDKVRNAAPSAGTYFLRSWRLMTGKKIAKSVITIYPQVSFDTIIFKTKKGVPINAWYIPSDSLAKGTVILFHGLGSSKSNCLYEASEFRAMDYNTLLIDIRAHGNSGGNSISMGMDESEEVKLAYEYLEKNKEKNIILWGSSLGASIITKAIADYNLHPKKIILEAPFASLQDHYRARASVLGFPREPFGWLVTLWTGIEQGYWGFSNKPSEYVKKINCPVLVQWGNKDEYVTQKEISSIYKSIKSSEKKLVVYDNMPHTSLCNYDNEKWVKEIKLFLSAN